MRRTENGGLEMFANVEVGEQVSLMTGSQNQLIERVTRVIQEASYKSYQESGVIWFFNYILCWFHVEAWSRYT